MTLTLTVKEDLGKDALVWRLDCDECPAAATALSVLRPLDGTHEDARPVAVPLARQLLRDRLRCPHWNDPFSESSTSVLTMDFPKPRHRKAESMRRANKEAEREGRIVATVSWAVEPRDWSGLLRCRDLLTEALRHHAEAEAERCVGEAGIE